MGGKHGSLEKRLCNGKAVRKPRRSVLGARHVSLSLLAGPDKLVLRCGPSVSRSLPPVVREAWACASLLSLGTDGGAHPEVACVFILRSRATQAAAKMNAQHDGSRSASLDHWLCVVVHAAPRTLTTGIVRFIPSMAGYLPERQKHVFLPYLLMLQVSAAPPSRFLPGMTAYH